MCFRINIASIKSYSSCAVSAFFRPASPPLTNQVILFCLQTNWHDNLASCCPCTEGKTDVAEDAAEGTTINRDNPKYIIVLL